MARVKTTVKTSTSMRPTAARPAVAVRPRVKGRFARVTRATKETDILVELHLDGHGRAVERRLAAMGGGR